MQTIDPVSDDKTNDLIETMHRYVEAVIDEDWTPNPNFMCGSCDYFKLCKNWKEGEA